MYNTCSPVMYQLRVLTTSTSLVLQLLGPNKYLMQLQNSSIGIKVFDSQNIYELATRVQ